ncbi:MAG: type II/IV secretion system ATPase subunit [Candidatus Pacearchaeota archaeon]
MHKPDTKKRAIPDRRNDGLPELYEQSAPVQNFSGSKMNNIDNEIKSIQKRINALDGKPEEVETEIRKPLSENLPIISKNFQVEKQEERAKENEIKIKLENLGKNKEEHQDKGPEYKSIFLEPAPDLKLVHASNESDEGEIAEKYNIDVDGATVEVKIAKRDNGVSYIMTIPQISSPTTALLTDIRNELIAVTSVSMQELIDPKSFIALKEKFKEDATRLIKEKIPTIAKDAESFLVGTLIQEMLGIGKVEYLINDPSLEEIVIVSAKEPIRVFSKKYGWLETNILLEREEVVINYANIIARRVGRQITVLNPLLDAHLVTGDRINAVLYPINTKGNTIVIRKFARDPYTIVDLIKNKTCDLEVSALIWLAIEYEMNVIISGGTASGKTVILNAFMPFVPPNQRIISIEDTKELILPEFLYWTPLVTRLPNAEGKGAVTMLDLLINALRMRPDRIILGEMRKQEEAMVLFEAMHTGHSVYATLHADSSTETISRLTHPPLNIPANLLKAINLNVVMFRDRRRGIRRISQVAEIEVGGDEAKANTLYRWSPETDTMIKHSKSSRFFEDIQRHTSMTDKEIEADLETKKKILDWLIKNNIRNMEGIGIVMNMYYKNKKELFDKMAKNDINFTKASK